MSKEVFLIDSNSLITPNLNFYPFDLAPGFWRQMSDGVESGEIAIIDLVEDEILKGNDSLKDWLSVLNVKNYIKHDESDIIKAYSDVLVHIQTNDCYKEAALKEWSRAEVADPWLIAAAKVKNMTIITFEKKTGGLNSLNPSKNAKIPDVANAFKVKTEDLYYMMRALKFKL